MIYGIGIDLIEIARIKLATENERFTERVFTEAERLVTKLQSNRLAGFFAAKEALLKAMGTGLAGFSWLEMEVVHDERGAPRFNVYGKIAEFLENKQITKIHLSISHGRDYAVAQVVLEILESRVI